MDLKAEMAENKKGGGPHPDLLSPLTDMLLEIDAPGALDALDLPHRMDQWILTYLNHRDTRGRPLPLPDLLGRVSECNAKITTRIIQDKIVLLEREQGLTPPLPFCWISMGSDARGEQVIRTDQDNALIYADPSFGQEATALRYFRTLAHEVTHALDRFGFTLCPGDVMASNPDWCRPLGHWLTALDNWVGSTDPDAVRKLTILLDFKAIFGDHRLAATLQTRVFTNFERHRSASHFLVRDDQLFAPPKTGFNRIRTRREKGCRRCFNLKTQAIAHIVNGARLFAVNHGIRSPATLVRLARLRDEGVLTAREYDDDTQAFIFLTRMKFTAHLAGQTKRLPHNCIEVSDLGPGEKTELKRALDAVTRFQKKMAATYNQTWMNFFN